jgi:hypothetical protein
MIDNVFQLRGTTQSVTRDATNIANNAKFGDRTLIPSIAAQRSIGVEYVNIHAPELGVSGKADGDRAMSDLTREEVKAQIDASEARTEVKIARLEGKIDLAISKLDSLRDDNKVVRTNQWVIGFGLALLIVAVATLFPAFFSIGTQVKDMVDNEVQLHFQTPPSKNNK